MFIILIEAIEDDNRSPSDPNFISLFSDPCSYCLVVLRVLLCFEMFSSMVRHAIPSSVVFFFALPDNNHSPVPLPKASLDHLVFVAVSQTLSNTWSSSSSSSSSCAALIHFQKVVSCWLNEE